MAPAAVHKRRPNQSASSRLPKFQRQSSARLFNIPAATATAFVTYNADGTFNFQDDAKGEGSGKWETSNNLFCEIFGAKAIQECGEFKSTGDAYFAAKSRLVEMKS